MALCSRSYVSTAGVRTGSSGRPCVSRRPVVTTRAGLGDAFNFVGQAFVRIFSPPRDDAPNNWTNTTSSFTGKIDHSSNKPFTDGYVAGGQKYGAAVAEPVEVEDQKNEVMDYVGGALERVVGKNFSDGSEPASTGSTGWKGSVHDRKTDGFHSRKAKQ